MSYSGGFFFKNVKLEPEHFVHIDPKVLIQWNVKFKINKPTPKKSMTNIKFVCKRSSLTLLKKIQLLYIYFIDIFQLHYISFDIFQLKMLKTALM